jgi:hypothetical protein
MTTDLDLHAEAERQDADERCLLCGGEPDRCGCQLEPIDEDESR